MIWPDFLCPLFLLSVSIDVKNAFGSFHPNPNRFNFYNSGNSPPFSSGKPTARHKNHCAYVVERSVSHAVQDGAAPYVKAEYNKCGWAKKCPALRYRMLYKPLYKVSYKTVTELEWRCCPGFTGVSCIASYGMKAMPPFKALEYKSFVPSQRASQPSIKGPTSSYKVPFTQFKSLVPAFKGTASTYNYPLHKGPTASAKGPISRPHYNINTWNNPLAPYRNFEGYLGPNVGPLHPEISLGPYPNPESDTGTGYPDAALGQQNSLRTEQESEMIPPHDYIPDDHEPVADYKTSPLPEHQQSVPETVSVRDTLLPSGDSELSHVTEEGSASVERLNRMEEDVQRLSLGVETLRAKITGLEDHLRASLREDVNRMLSTLLFAAPALAADKTQQSTVGFENLHGGAPDIEESAVVHFPNLRELAEKVAELGSELLVKSKDLTEIRQTVQNHNGVLQRLTEGALNFTGFHQDLETLVENRLRDAEASIIEKFQMRVESAKELCKGHLKEVQMQCKKEIMERQEQFEQVINGSVTALKMELEKLHAEPLESENFCCSEETVLIERLALLEQSMDGLNQSQMLLQASLAGHKDHVEGMIVGRLAYVESILNSTEMQPESVGDTSSGIVQASLEKKINNLENRVFAAVKELGNATSPALLGSQAVFTTKTEIEYLRKKVELDVDRIQKQVSSLKLFCISSCVPQPALTGYVAPVPTIDKKDKIKHKNLIRVLSGQTERLNRLNATLKSLINQLAERQVERILVSEVSLLKVRISSVNNTLCGLKDFFGRVMREVGQTNFTWQQREEKLAQQVKGVVQLIGQQASMLGAGERRLTRLKGEVHDLRRRLAMELQSCCSTTLGIQKEVSEVGGRVTRVEGQCGAFSQLSEDLELIRSELDKHSDGYFQVNSTLIKHSLQLAELRDGLKSCSKGTWPTKSRSDDFITITPLLATQPIADPPYPRGDQFISHTQDGQLLLQGP